MLNSLFSKILYTDHPPLPLWIRLSELSEVLSPRLQSSFSLKQNLTHSSHIVHLFSRHRRIICKPQAEIGWGRGGRVMLKDARGWGGEHTPHTHPPHTHPHQPHTHTHTPTTNHTHTPTTNHTHTPIPTTHTYTHTHQPHTHTLPKKDQR